MTRKTAKTVRRLGKASGGLIQAVAAPIPGWRDRLDMNRPSSRYTDPTMITDPSGNTLDTNEGRAFFTGPSQIGMARGGKISRVAGKPIGKDDGVIPVKRGEYVVKKASVRKYGGTKMAAVNRGTAKVTAGSKANRKLGARGK